MKLQVLIAAMHQKDYSLIEKMNIKTDAIVGNQCDRNSVEEVTVNNHKVTYYNFNERGVGLNRNNALMRANGDILIFADDDEVFASDYKEIIEQAYTELPKADAIVFNIETVGVDVGRRKETATKKVRLINAFNYGMARITVKNAYIKNKNITFHRSFGGGAEYSCGEDTLFIADLLKSKANIYVYPETIATVSQTESTWFKGYNEKYFYDKGALFAALPFNFKWLLCLLSMIKNRKNFFENISLKNGISLARSGFKGFKKHITYEKFVELEKH